MGGLRVVAAAVAFASLAIAACGADAATGSTDWVLGVYHDRDDLPQSFVTGRSVANLFVYDDGSVVERSRSCWQGEEAVRYGTWTAEERDRVRVESAEPDDPLSGSGPAGGFELVRVSGCETIERRADPKVDELRRGEACARALPPGEDPDLFEYDSCELYECGDPALTRRCFTDPPPPP